MAETLTVNDGSEASVFDSQLTVAAKLERARTELLDLSARNRLLNMPRSGKTARIIEMIDEKSIQVLRLLVTDQKALTFLAGRVGEKLPIVTDTNGEPVDDPDDDDGLIAELAQPEDDGVDASGNRNRHVDTRLQTRLTPQGLQKRLLDMYHDARTLEEEQGVNILFLALGTLRWVDPSNPKNIRHAPLLLIPVALERGNAAEKFKLRWRQEEVASNLSLEAFLAKVHGITLPPFEGGDDLDLSRYVEGVREAVSAKPDWSVETDDIALGFFSFAKFLMYRDLDPELWPADAKLSEHQLIKPLLADGFEAGEPLLDEDAPMDAHIGPADMIHIVDSDSSQTRAVHEVRRGRDIVIQGPPGCGKSQTIANIIASGIADGKTVLFVAEKMAALEVVKRRLDNTGVGDACLELHSHKANKRSMLEELRRTWELGVPRGEGAGALEARLLEARDRLNAHAERMHAPLGAAELTPFLVVGHLTRLKAKGRGPADLALEGPAAWTWEGTRQRSVLIAELAERLAEMGTPATHVWRGVEIEHALPDYVDRLTRRIGGLAERCELFSRETAELSQVLESDLPATFSELDAIADLARRVASAPDVDAEALASSAWVGEREEITALVATGRIHTDLATQLESLVHTTAWETDVTTAAAALGDLPPEFPVGGFARQRQITELAPRVLDMGTKTALACGRDDPPTTARGARALAQLAERVASVPPADTEAITAAVWKTGVERAGNLAAAVQALSEAREVIGDRLAESAWSLDATDVRRVIAEHGSGFMRYLSGEWRRANRTVRSVLANPKTSSEDQIALLDALIKGRRAAEAIEGDADFGRQAFGADWRGTKTPPAPLGALVDWMRSLGSDADEARRLVARRPDSANLARQATELLTRCSDLQPLLEDSWRDMGGTAPVSATPDEANLVEAAARAQRIVEAFDVYSSISRNDPSTIAEMCDALNALQRGQVAKAEIDAGEPLGRLAFGTAWKGAETDWAKVSEIVDWIVENGEIRELAARVVDRQAVAKTSVQLISDRDDLVRDIEALVVDLRATPASAIDPSQVSELQVVGIEGPVHLDEVVARIRDAWGARRAGARIKESIERAAAVAIRQKRLAKDGDFLSVPGREAKARDRSTAASASLRKPECLPPAEVAAAVLDVARRNFGATEDQAVLAVSRAFGIKATSAQTRAVITNAIAKAIGEEQLIRREGLIELGPNAPAPVARPNVDEGELEALIGAGEGERVEFKQTLRWDVVQGIPNRKLEDVVVKTIAAFANTVGGTLLIGVKDNGEVIGIDADVSCLGGDLDKFELHLTTLIGKHFNQAFNASRIKVRFPSVSEKTVCRIDVERARTEIYVTTADRNGVAAERFFVRTGNSTQELRTSEIATYVAEHFPK